jgi:NADH dehydrogenase
VTVPRILIIGGGYVGMYTALRLQKKLRRGEAQVTVVDPRSYMTYQPFLPEAAAGSLSPRHVVVPLRPLLRDCQVVTGWVTGVDHANRTARIRPLEGSDYDLPYTLLVVAAGSVARTLPIPGLAEAATGFKTVEEAIQLRNRVLECLDIAESTRDPDVRRRNLTFVVVGGGYAGVEALAELADLTRYATRNYASIEREDLRWLLVEASDRILPEVDPDMGDYTLEQLRLAGIDVRLRTRLESVVGGHVVLSDGDSFDSDTVVWTAGVRPHPVLERLGLPLSESGRLVVSETLQVPGEPDAFGAGDCCAVPDLTGEPGALCSPSAQHAVRQAGQLADNAVARLRGFEPRPYRHKHAGSVASLGLHKGVAQVYGIKLRGWPAWFMHRTYHMSRVPTLNRKVRVIAEWTLALFFRREVVSLWAIHEPFESFTSTVQQRDVPPAHGEEADAS